MSLGRKELGTREEPKGVRLKHNVQDGQARARRYSFSEITLKIGSLIQTAVEAFKVLARKQINRILVLKITVGVKLNTRSPRSHRHIFNSMRILITF